MKRKLLLLLLILTVVSVAACSAQPAEQVALEQPAPLEAERTDPPAVTASGWDQATQVDEQGAVVVEATPLNLNEQADTLEFEVAMNTHSVDLSMDLAQLATLTTDTGKTVQATLWDAPRGGHHIDGKLLFPSTLDGKPILDGANSITIQIHDVDISLREFVWKIQ